jgi:glycosyltransferase involved in cell wall biosynthesis
MKELSIIITVKDEEENIKPLLESIRSALSGIDYEVILVDDGLNRQDQTANTE